ncbi:MAG TPA: hypothetical protein VJA85_02760 [Candidatus Limnocylindria bacterium]|nr:hypothetical protein [Candidatus Limnocylindria bacterium]
MNGSFPTLKAIGYSFGTAIVGSLLVLLIGMWIFGSELNQRAVWQGAVLGVAGTIAGVAGAVEGLRFTSRTGRPEGN